VVLKKDVYAAQENVRTKLRNSSIQVRAVSLRWLSMRYGKSKIIDEWKEEEKFPFEGWDFSYLKGRKIEEKPPWDYIRIARRLVRKSSSLLDMGTGGGEIFSRLSPFPKYTVATEGYKPNIAIARKRLKPLGVEVIGISKNLIKLPFENETFDMVLNRHEAFDAKEVYRMLKKNGIFLTQQVGRGNLNDLAKTFGTNTEYSIGSLENSVRNIKSAGFKIKYAKKWKGKIEFKDVGAIVYFLKAIPWIIPKFNVNRNLRHLIKLQNKMNRNKILRFTQARYIILAQKI